MVTLGLRKAAGPSPIRCATSPSSSRPSSLALCRHRRRGGRRNERGTARDRFAALLPPRHNPTLIERYPQWRWGGFSTKEAGTLCDPDDVLYLRTDELTRALRAIVSIEALTPRSRPCLTVERSVRMWSGTQKGLAGQDRPSLSVNLTCDAHQWSTGHHGAWSVRRIRSLAASQSRLGDLA